MRTAICTGTVLLMIASSCGLSAENLEKAQKKELETQAKAIIAEAKTLEQNSGSQKHA